MDLQKFSINMKENFEPMDCNGDVNSIYSPAMEPKDRADIIDQGDINEDLYSQLLQKENDLQLAAELGKALLEENHELTRKVEQQSEEYSRKIEEITQQKYDFKYKLESVEGEFDTTVKEFQSDIAHYQLELEKQKQQSCASDKSRSQLVQDLTQQNERLTEHMKKQKSSEDHLEGQVQSLRQQLQARRISMTEHTSHLHVLREEVNLLTDQKHNLERKVYNVSSERDTITCSLEETQDRIIMLEKQILEQDHRIRQQDSEIIQLQEGDCSIGSKFEEFAIPTCRNGSTHEAHDNSLLSELTGSIHEHSTSTPNASPSSSKKQYSPNLHTRRPHLCSTPGLPYGVGHMDDDIECDDDLHVLSSYPNQSNPISDNVTIQAIASLWTPQLHADAKIYTMEMKQEMLEVFRSLNALIYELKGIAEDWEPSSVHTADIRVGAVLQLVADLKDITMSKNDLNSVSHGKLEELENKIEALTMELSQTQSSLDKARNDIMTKDQELKHKAKDMEELANKIKLSLKHDDMKKLQEERDRLQDEAMGLSPDQVLQQTRRERDETIERSNKLECDLVQARVDIVSLDAQLMDAIQQKLDLSQQLELWQVDMQELIGSTVVTRLQQEKKPAASKQVSPQPPKRKLKFSFPWN